MSSPDPIVAAIQKRVDAELTKKLAAYLKREPTPEDWNDVEHEVDEDTDRELYSIHGDPLMQTAWMADDVLGFFDHRDEAYARFKVKR
ncbi:MAG TPA: hypothetical protein VKG92_03110 [Flavobacteriales bacterium]|nr:hypothetical protein [Flavobacteriales bacterium]